MQEALSRASGVTGLGFARPSSQPRGSIGRARWAIAVGCLVFAVPDLAWAKPSAEELAVARQLYEKAVAAQEKNDWAQCEEAVTEALGIIETPGLRFHQAHCKEQQGKWIEALVDYKRSEELIQGGVEASDVEPLLKPAIGRLESKVPRLTVNVENEPEQVSFYLDGKERSSKLLGKGVQLNPGSHAVEVSAPGYDAATRSVSLKEGERSEVTLRLVSNGSATSPDSEAAGAGEVGDGDSSAGSRRSSGGRVSAKPFVLAGEGLVVAGLAGLGIYYFVDAERQDEARDNISDTLPDGACANRRAEFESECLTLSKYIQDVKDKRTYGYIALGGAGAAAAVLITTWLAWDDSPRVIVGVDSDFTGVLVSGKF